MASKRAHDATGSTDDAWKSSYPAVLFYKKRGMYALRSQHKVTKGNKNGTQVSAFGYPTEEAAKLERDLFRFAVHRDCAKDWDNFNVSSPRNARYEAMPRFPRGEERAS